LLSVLVDRDYNVRGYAARSIGNMGAMARAAAPALEQALQRETAPEVRAVIEEALAEIRAVN
jgi:HEAT repeat protein